MKGCKERSGRAAQCARKLSAVVAQKVNLGWEEQEWSRESDQEAAAVMKAGDCGGWDRGSGIGDGQGASLERSAEK